MTADPLELAAWEMAASELRPEELPRLATDALVRGRNSPALGRLAGQDSADVRDCRDLFVLALDELGIPIPSRDAALWNLVWANAQSVIDGRLAPEVAVRRIWRWQGEVEDSGDLRIFVGLASELEDHPEDRARLERDIVEQARVLLQRPRPRIWVKLMARLDQSPLSRSMGDGAAEIDADDLPISGGLRSEISEWRTQHREVLAGWPDHGGFPSVRDAERFVERGREIVSRLQAELGPEYHVEYMPEPIRPPGIKLQRG